MNHSEQAPLSHMIDIALQAHLDRLNAAFAEFKRIEIAAFKAEIQREGDKLIHLWHAKNQAAQAYMQEWDILVRYGTVTFDDETETFQLISDAGNNQPLEAE
jgi:hypothetical protein